HRSQEEHQQSSNGTLILTATSRDDNGEYKCEASNGIGQTLQKIVTVTIKPPPKVLPFVIPKNLLVGESVSFICSAASGSKPLKFMWIKDDATVHRGTALRITDSADYSTLTIESLKTSDAGNYTCVVSNSGGTVSHSDVLHVKGGQTSEYSGHDVIQIASASKKDEGHYKCHISNDIGADLYKTVTVAVKCMHIDIIL
ncbi:hypothetical protein MRX96_053231, partial [Rhipicephalus microplus]